MRGKTVETADRRAWAALEAVLDPEVPVLSVVELGIVRAVRSDREGLGVAVTITPTYSGCPAMPMIEDSIRAALTRAGFAPVTIHTVYAPAWTTDWMSDSARAKLRASGIAPPGPAASDLPVAIQPSRPAAEPPSSRAPECPLCGSTETVIVSEFGATACKSLHLCRSCRQPFEHFKPF